jgi:hypothetical protein
MSTQCEGKTKSGARCKNKTRNAGKRCHLHVDAVSALPEKIVKKKPVVSGGKKELSEQGSDKSEKTECCVCMEEMPETDKLDCSHPVCRGCLGQLRSDKCPMCRREVSAVHIKKSDKKKMCQRQNEDHQNRNLQATMSYFANFAIIPV